MAGTQHAHYDQVIPLLTPENAEGTIIFGDSIVTCYCGIMGWCAHVEDVIHQGKDRLDDLLSDIDHGTFSVPLVPTHKLWVEVGFRAMGQDRWTIDVDDSRLDLRDFDTFLGLLTPHDNRGAVRSMVMAWFDKLLHQYSNVTLICKAGTHALKQARLQEIAKRDYDTPFLFADQWSLFWHGVCMDCYKRVLSIEDLVPVDESANSWTSIRPDPAGNWRRY